MTDLTDLTNNVISAALEAQSKIDTRQGVLKEFVKFNDVIDLVIQIINSHCSSKGVERKLSTKATSRHKKQLDQLNHILHSSSIKAVLAILTEEGEQKSDNEDDRPGLVVEASFMINDDLSKLETRINLIERDIKMALHDIIMNEQYDDQTTNSRLELKDYTERSALVLNSVLASIKIRNMMQKCAGCGVELKGLQDVIDSSVNLVNEIPDDSIPKGEEEKDVQRKLIGVLADSILGSYDFLFDMMMESPRSSFVQIIPTAKRDEINFAKGKIAWAKTMVSFTIKKE